MSIRLGVIMDPISTINPKKDSTLAMLSAACKKGWEVIYMEQTDLFTREGRPYANMRPLEARLDLYNWYSLGDASVQALESLDIILMRKDPPFDMEFIYTTYILDQAKARGALVCNDPAALRDINEKFSSTWFPSCAPPSIVTRNPALVREFIAEHGDIVIKPLDGMGGASIFRIRKDDPNTGVILETLIGKDGSTTAIAQRFLPEYKQGDKRILLIEGEPVPYALARIPAEGESRANLAAGGTGVGVELTKRDREICSIVGPELKIRGVQFAGLDVIGDYLTEINVTSPTCIRELDTQFGLDIGAQLMDALEMRLRTQ